MAYILQGFARGDNIVAVKAFEYLNENVAKAMESALITKVGLEQLVGNWRKEEEINFEQGPVLSKRQFFVTKEAQMA